MSMWARLKSWAGGRKPDTITTASGQTTLTLPEHGNTFYIETNDAVTIATINAEAPVLPGRVVMLIGAGDDTTTFTNDDTPTSRGQMDLGGSDRALSLKDVLWLMQEADGSWLMVNALLNN